MTGPCTQGLSTKEALSILWTEINSAVKEQSNRFKKRRLHRLCLAVFNDDSPLHWFSILITVLCIGCLFVLGQCCAASLLTLLLLTNICLVAREYSLKEREMFTKIQYVLDDIHLAIELSEYWTSSNYPNLWSPVSPCIALQCTYRDGQLINLPWSLLVKGDCIVMRPGQTAPGPCTELNGSRAFISGQTYSQDNKVNPPKRPTARVPMVNLICVMDTSPYLENLSITMTQFLDKPQTIHNQQRHFLVTNCVQKWGSISAVVVTLLGAILNTTGLVFTHHQEAIDWWDMFVAHPVAVVVPLLPLLFPVLWIALNLWGMAKLETLISMPRPFDDGDTEGESSASLHKGRSFQEDLDTPIGVDWDNMKLPFRSNMGNFLGLVRGSAHSLGRSANVVGVLGSITALTCVDKKGILSWPNPTAEKIFFLRDSTKESEGGGGAGKDGTDDSTSECDSEPSVAAATQKQSTVAEVLDLTHDQHSPFRLEFDDHEWKYHINSLKPLGLAILVNTCCPLTQAYYAKFCGHVTAVSLFDPNLIPVTNRYALVESSMNSFMHGRCLCELAKQIGFSKQARDIFSLEGKVACYRHLQPEVVRRDIRFARSLQISTKVKVPFPHSMSVVMKEAASGNSLQLLTQGTADIILDCCDDFWDGQDLKPLRAQDRKRAQDFYQRNALTAYCTAFAYRPLRHGIFGALAGSQENVAYLELPPETKQRMEHQDKFKCDFASHESSHNRNNNSHHHHLHNHSPPAHQMSHSLSTDSLLFNEAKESDVSDVDGCFEMQCHQVFIGMVTMQYQAQTDIVKLIEGLERACIRFVHFSKENELRSRVFSEKMGLESGWNCHISLLSEDPSDVQSPKSSKSAVNQERTGKGNKSPLDIELTLEDPLDANCLLKPCPLEASKSLSSSAPGAIAQPEEWSEKREREQHEQEEEEDSLLDSNDRNEDDLPGQSMSCLTDSSDQSVQVNFDMSNRAKLPRGIENIRPHLENVDNVPLLVSLFTDCSAEATKEMLKIMQSYGEVVVCLGSSASSTNVEIFLQADLSIAIEPLYPQVCQDYPAYNEANIFHNRRELPPRNAIERWFPETSNQNKTISPIYLSRMLNSICCSISVCRDEPLSITALIELSRRFTTGLWNCVQFLICCGCSIALINLLSALLALPPVFPPTHSIGLMCVTCPVIAASLARISSDRKIMTKAMMKKSTKVGTRLLVFVVWCYGLKFIPLVLFVLFSYSAFMAHPLYLAKSLEEDYEDNLRLARIVSLFAVVLHFVTVSSSFVHRDFLFWKRNVFKNRYWAYSSILLLTIHGLIMTGQIFTDSDVEDTLSRKWPVMVCVLCSVLVTFVITELCKWQEIKANVRYQRRARLDFGTKLGMNSPF